MSAEAESVSQLNKTSNDTTVMNIPLKKKKALGEVDYENEVQVEFPVRNPPRDMPKTEVMWVTVTKGTKDKGYGYITQHARFDIGVEPGQTIEFCRGTHKDIIPVVEADPKKPRSKRRFNVKTVMPNEYATFVKVAKSRVTVAKRIQSFKNGIAEELWSALTFNPMAQAQGKRLPTEELSLKAGDKLSGGGSDWCVEAILTKAHVVLCRCINTNRLQKITARELSTYTRLPSLNFGRKG